MNAAPPIYKIFIIMGLALFCVARVSADSPAFPSPYVIKKGKYVFVMHTGSWTYKGEKDVFDRESFYKKNCVNIKQNSNKKLSEEEKQDIKDKCYKAKILNRYRQSGLYLGENAKQPLWTIDWYAFNVILASDGIHLVRLGGWASDPASEAVSFYKNGKLIAGYQVGDLVDDKNQLQHTVSHFFWRKATSYDEKSMRYSISTVDGNEFTFNIRSGRIEKFSKETSPTFRAELVLDGGKIQRLHDVRSCTNAFVDHLMREPNIYNKALVVIANKTAIDKAIETHYLSSLPFKNIHQARRIEKIREGQFVWRIVAPTKESKDYIVERGYSRICGTTNSGNELNISIADISELMMSLDEPIAKPENIRPIELRMRWDHEKWLKLRDDFCDKAKFVENPNVVKVNQLLNQYDRLECQAENIGYQKMMKDAGNWTLNQPQSVGSAELANRIASIFQSNNQFENLISYYEYQLATVTNTKLNSNGESGSRNLWSQSDLMEKIIAASSKTGNEEKRLEYTEKLAVIKGVQNQIIEKRKISRKQETDDLILQDIKILSNTSVATLKSDHEFLLSPYKWRFRTYCGAGAQEQAKMVSIINKTIKMEKQLHAGGHQHVLNSLEELIRCYNYYDIRGMSVYKRAFDEYVSLERKERLSYDYSVVFADLLRAKIDHLFNNLVDDRFLEKNKISNVDKNKYRIETKKLVMAIDKILLARHKKMGNSIAALDKSRTLATAAILYEDDLQQAKYYFGQAKGFVANIETSGTEWDSIQAKKALDSLEFWMKKTTAKTQKEKIAVDKAFLARYKKQGNSKRAFDISISLVTTALYIEKDISQANYYINEAKNYLAHIERSGLSRDLNIAKRKIDDLEVKIKNTAKVFEKEKKERKAKNEREAKRKQAIAQKIKERQEWERKERKLEVVRRRHSAQFGEEKKKILQNAYLSSLINKENEVKSWRVNRNDTSHLMSTAWEVEAYCLSGESSVKKYSVNILSQILTKEEHLHATPHEHLLKLSQYLALCYATDGNESKTSEYFVGALNYDLKMDLPAYQKFSSDDLKKPYFAKLASYLFKEDKRPSKSELIILRQHLNKYFVFEDPVGTITVVSVIVNYLKNKSETKGDMAYFEKGLALSRELFEHQRSATEYLDWLKDFYAKFADKNEPDPSYIEKQLKKKINGRVAF